MLSRSNALSFQWLNVLQRTGAHMERRWKEKAKTEAQLSATGDVAAVTAAETVTNKIAGLSIGENGGKTGAHGSVWKPKSYGTASGGAVTEVENGAGVEASVASAQKNGGSGLSKIFRGNLLEKFSVNNSTYTRAQIRATFYPKFENEKSDQEVYSFCLAFFFFFFFFFSCSEMCLSCDIYAFCLKCV